MSNRSLTVLKLGGSVLRSERDLPRAVSEVYRCWRAGRQVVAVVSALGATTDELLRRAEQLGLPPRSPAFPAYLGGGEHASATLLTLALHRAGLPATYLDATAAGLLTAGDPWDAEPQALDRERLRRELAEAIVVLPGFVGHDRQGRPTLLGRGGSDLTALFVAAELGASCVLLKDAGALYTADPARHAAARRFDTLSWATALRTAGPAVQEKALRFTQRRGLAFAVRAPGAPTASGTRVGPYADRLADDPAAPPPPLRVALLGCGTVGVGVLRHLLDRPQRFTLTGVAVRRPERARDEVPPGLLVGVEELLARPADVLVEVAGGLVAGDWIATAIARGRHVVTANKALLAERGGELTALAGTRGVRLLASATVGGALPALEAVARLARDPGIVALRGVLNGTSSFVLDRLGHGDTLAEALAEARRRGFAEADATLDLDGSDAAQKLALLLRAAAGASVAPAGRVPLDWCDLDWRDVERRGIDAALATRVRSGGGQPWRLVAHASLDGDGARARVGPEDLAPRDPLAAGHDAACALELTLRNGDVVRLAAQGAGRWPTAEAVLADLEELWRTARRDDRHHEQRSKEGHCEERSDEAISPSVTSAPAPAPPPVPALEVAS